MRVGTADLEERPGGRAGNSAGCSKMEEGALLVLKWEVLVEVPVHVSIRAGMVVMLLSFE